MIPVYAVAVDSGYCQRAAADTATLFRAARELSPEASLFLLRAGHSEAPLPGTPEPYTLLTACCSGFPLQQLASRLDGVLPKGPGLWLFGPGGTGHQLAHFFACARDLPVAGYAASLSVRGDRVEITRPVYTSCLTATLSQPLDSVAAFGKGALPPAPAAPPAQPVKTIELEPIPARGELQVRRESLAAPLITAKRVIAAGRGVSSRAGLERLERLARRLDAQLAVSRPIATNGWTGQDRLVGVSGEVISPDVCLVMGASGMPAFLYGVQGAQHLLAVNTDPHAAVFTRAEQGTVAGWEELCGLLEDMTEPNG